MRTVTLLTAMISLSSAQVIDFEWNYLNFTWTSTEHYERAVESESYVPKNNIITGIKVWKDKVYLSLPRWKNGVPVTLAVIDAPAMDAVATGSSPLLRPYPNWEMQRLDDCGALQYVQSMEIDPQGRMWVLENGRTEFLTSNPRTKCRPRLLILDLYRDGRILMDYAFPEGEVVHGNDVFLNDLVLDHEDGGWAYITDHSSIHPGIIVFSLREKTSWKVSHESMLPKEEASRFLVDGTVFEVMGPVDGIALSQASTKGDRILYYTPLTSYEVFSIPVSALKDRRPIDVEVKLVGRKSSQTDGMIVDSLGLLYFGLLSENKVARWHANGSETLADGREILVNDAIIDRWPDTFAIDESRRLWWTTNRLTRFMADALDLSDKNYRVLHLQIESRSYQYYEDGTYPRLPAILHSSFRD